MEDVRNPAPSGDSVASAEMQAALFANLVAQQANMALMFLGKLPHPQGDKAAVELDAATLIIDQLDMLEHKTKGNLSPQESDLLRRTLMSLRMAFVEAASETPAEAPSAGAPPPPASKPAAAPAGAEPASANDPPAVSEEESRKKFTKKY